MTKSPIRSQLEPIASSINRAPPLAKRFYKTAATVQSREGFCVELDGRVIKTPAGNTLCVPTQRLAEAIASEWQRQETVIDPAAMPLTKLSNSTLDGVVFKTREVIDEIASFAGFDVVCYRTEAPQELVAQQASAWDPVLAWAATAFGVRWICGSGVMPVEQSPETVEAVHDRLGRYDPFQLAALHEMTVLTGSILLPLACVHGQLSLDAMWRAANLDEDWQIAQWGEDAEALQRREGRWCDVEAAYRLFQAVSDGDA